MSSSQKITSNVCAVIPFLNERNTIDIVVEKVLKYIDKVIAVDDGSTDGSADTLKNIENVIVVKHSVNKGKGAALNTGFTESVKQGSTLTLTIDADLQHDTELIPEFIDAAENHDIVIGNRLSNLKSMPLHRRLSNKLTSKMLSMKTGTEIKDSQSGYRIYRTSILDSILPKSTGFEAESEILVNAARRGYKIGFVDIPTIYNNNESKMRSWDTIKGFVKVMFMK